MTGYIALFGWPLAATAFFVRFTLPMAICVTIIGGYLFLPLRPVIDLPLVPSFDKDLIPALAALLLAILVKSDPSVAVRRPGLVPRQALVLGLLAVLMAGSVLTAMTNGDPLRYGPRTVPALSLYDGLSSALIGLVTVLPLLLGRAYLSNLTGQRTILVVLAILGSVYAVLALYEIRMSPQLNRMVYGFFPHEWIQHIRGSGWRPIVFLEHGLWLAIFLCMAALAAFGVTKTAQGKLRRRAPWLALFITGTLVLAGNLGAVMIFAVLAPVLLFMPMRLQMFCAAGLAALVLLYPMARANGIAPIDRILSVARTVSTERAASLEFRLSHEDALLAKAKERPLFGWGGWGRNRIYDERGRDLSVTDGYWIIVFGHGGWMRYVAVMGLLCLPVILLAWRRPLALRPETAALTLVLTANLIDLIPNAGISPVTWLIAGALWGHLARGGSDEDTPDEEDVTVPAPVSSYTRQSERIDRHRTPLPSAARSARQGTVPKGAG